MANARETCGSILDPNTLRHLFRQLEATDVDELEVQVGPSRLYLRREPGRRTRVEPGEQPLEAQATDELVIAAPLTGMFYARPSPDQPAFVEPGGHVELGQVVALIETMKLFNEVTAEVAGEVLSVNAADGDLVEAGQPLMYVRMREDGGEL